MYSDCAQTKVAERYMWLLMKQMEKKKTFSVVKALQEQLVAVQWGS